MSLRTIASVQITPNRVIVNDRELPVAAASGHALLSALYKERIGGYPKFYKMDPLCRLGFVASELLLEAEGARRFVEREDRAIVLVNRTASQAADRAYEETIRLGDDYFPSPAGFVYTLPNIVTGEIALRNLYYGETHFLCIDSPDEEQICRLVATALADEQTHSVVGGWLECPSADEFEAHLAIYTTENELPNNNK